MMQKVNLMALLVGAALFTGLGATSALAGMGDKCGGNKPSGKCGNGDQPAGKCGEAKAMKPGKCGGEKMESPAGKCGEGKAMNPGRCGGE
ncbi:MAG: hypothetical protein U9N38_00085, partial [Thermodesulfobacteriota bacterium]|nr:hypothetical protein [Thermodesulfobacteriota bacterium]